MSLGRFKIFTYVKPSETATMSTHKVSKFLSERLGQPLEWTSNVGEHDLDTLIIVAGGVPFCQCLPALARAVLRSERVIYASLDYVSRLPTITGRGKSPYRAAFRLRHKRGMRPADYWTTVEPNALLTPDSAYVNWNILSWNPTFAWRGKLSSTSLVYYGSSRKSRFKTFDRFFRRTDGVRVVVSNNSGWAEQYGEVESVAVKGPDLTSFLCAGGVGLYLEDPLASSVAMSPAGRFYEMLGAGLPMVFQEESVETLGHYGYDVSRYVVRKTADARRFIRSRVDVAEEQRNSWVRDYTMELSEQFWRAAA